MEQFENRLPHWATTLLRLIVHPDFQEEIEGDLLEKYHADRQQYGRSIARRLLYVGILSLIKFNLVFNLNRNVMKTQNWYVFLLVALLVTLASVAPFLPGPQNDFSHGLSQFAQIIGYIGLFFIPFGLIWLIIEIRNRNGQKLNRWTNGYYPALLTISPFFVLITIQFFRGIREGGQVEMAPFIFIWLGVAYVVYRIQKLKSKTEYQFNKAPVYIVLIPLIALLTSQFAVEKIAELTRETAIQKTEPLIAAIEKFKSEKGEYPEKLEDLTGKYIQSIPIFHKMGNSAYFYEKRGNVYQLSFERNWHWNATEAVVYMKYGNKITKSNYDNYPTNHPDWRYFMVD
jgi:hypothetical protein